MSFKNVFRDALGSQGYKPQPFNASINFSDNEVHITIKQQCHKNFLNIQNFVEVVIFALKSASKRSNIYLQGIRIDYIESALDKTE